MAERTVLVRLKADASNFNKEMAEAAAAAKALKRELDGSQGSTKKSGETLVSWGGDAESAAESAEHLGNEVEKTGKKTDGSSGAFSKFVKNLDSSNNRTSMLVQTLITLGPALVPVGAVAVPAIAGLTTELAFAGVAAGVTALAFSGIGTALKAVNDYQLDPTEAHLKKLRIEMGKLGPAGRDFVKTLQELRPQLQTLQDVAQAGLLPGAAEGIQELMQLLPQMQQIVGTVAGTLGDLLAEGGDNLNDAKWVDFFTYLNNEARPILTDMGHTLGNFIEGIAHMIQAFNPLSQDFSGWFLNMSRDFNNWASGLSQNQSFQDFVDYIEASGPQVTATFGAIVDAVVALVQAAAPVGGVVLKALEGLANVLAAIARSKVGPTLIGIAVAMSALSRAMAIGQLLGGNALLALIRGLGRETPRAVLGMSSLAGAAGVLALSMTDVDEKMGLSNTAMYASMGLIAGPWGAAIGAGVGLTLDLAAANNDAEDAIKGVNTALQSDSYARIAAAAITAAKASDTYNDSLNNAKDSLSGRSGFGTDDYWGLVGDKLKLVSNVFSHTGVEVDAAALKADKAAKSFVTALQAIYTASHPNDTNTILKGSADDVQAYVTTLIPALQQAGLSFDDIRDKPDEVARAVDAYTRATGKVPGVTGPLRTALQTANDELERHRQHWKDVADAATDALDAQMAYEEAIDAGAAREQERKGVLDDIAQAKRDGEKERADIRQSAADAAADRARNLTEARRDYRRAKTPDEKHSAQQRIDDVLRDGARAARDTQQQITDSLDRQAEQIKDLKVQLAQYKRTLDIGTAAGRANVAIINTEAEKWNALTPAEQNKPGAFHAAREAIIRDAMRLGGLTRKDALAWIAKNMKLALPPWKVKVLLDDKKARERIAEFKRRYDAIKPKTVKITLKTFSDVAAADYNRATHAPPPGSTPTQADGGMWQGRTRTMDSGGLTDTGAYVPRIPQIRNGGNILWSEPETGWEAYISGKPGMESRNLDIWRRAGAKLGANFVEYANGNLAFAQRASSPVRTVVNNGAGIDYDRLAGAVSGQRPLYGDVTLSPHNYSEFKREMHRDMVAANGGGVSF